MKFIIFLVLIGLILPAYANVIDPISGVSTCEGIQNNIDAGAKSWNLASTILDNMDNSISGHIRIIDSDCFYDVYLTNSFDGIWKTTIQIDDSEKKEFDLTIKNGKITDNEFDIIGLVYNSDRLVIESRDLHEHLCFGYAEFIHHSDYSTIIIGDIDCFDDITGTIESEKNFFSRLGEPTIDTFDGIYDITFVTPFIDGDVEKFVIVGEIKIENGVITSEQIEKKYFTSMPNDYEGTVTGNGTVSIFGPCITSGEGYYGYLQFVDDIATGEVGCDSSIPISAAKVTLIPTGQSFPGFTTMSLLDSEKSETDCGAGTILKDGQCIPESNTKSSKDLQDMPIGHTIEEYREMGSGIPKEENGGGCLIATATYGSELAPQVQLLRELRDNSLLQTESGTSFMNTFNDVYYSFSPYIADYERENPLFREAVKIVITPMIASLSILNYVDMDSENSVLGNGISLIILNLMMYIGVPVIAIVGIKKRK